MKWTGAYFLGFIILLSGILAALWKTGVLASIGPTWTGIGLLVVIGLGLMAAVANSGSRETIDIDHH
ncbi:MAG: hypothetical protein JNK60_07040 [Acidobacteria bacterium]|nr:hypothetical protein [Acidobacteriota bacterium]